MCWNLVIACVISVAVCFIGEYLHKRCVHAPLLVDDPVTSAHSSPRLSSPYVMAQESVDLAQAAFAEGRWSDCIDHYTEVIDAGYALTSAWARRGVAKHERGDSHDALGALCSLLHPVCGCHAALHSIRAGVLGSVEVLARACAVDLTTALEIDREARMPNSKHDGVMALNAYHRGSALNTRGRVRNSQPETGL